MAKNDVLAANSSCGSSLVNRPVRKASRVQRCTQLTCVCDDDTTTLLEIHDHPQPRLAPLGELQ